MKKRIGITYTETNFKNYPAWFTELELGDDLELVILSFEKNNVEDINRCDGFVLTGGIDVDPSFYNGSNEYANKPTNFLTTRDEFEAKVYRYAKEKSLPVLGICRGMQLVNVLEGGSLVQDLGSDGNLLHKRDTQDKQHDVNIIPGTLLNEIAGGEMGQVNSAHHQAVQKDTISSSLQANAWSSEIIEGLEYKDKTGKPFMLCVQWHPERMVEKETNPLSQKIKAAFIAAVKNTK